MFIYYCLQLIRGPLPLMPWLSSIFNYLALNHYSGARIHTLTSSWCLFPPFLSHTPPVGKPSLISHVSFLYLFLIWRIAYYRFSFAFLEIMQTYVQISPFYSSEEPCCCVSRLSPPAQAMRLFLCIATQQCCPFPHCWRWTWGWVLGSGCLG